MSKLFEAGGTIRVSRFVKGGAADHVVLEADANEKIVGISHPGGREAPIPSLTADPVEAAQAGEHLAIFGIGEEDTVHLVAGSGGLTRFDEVESDADGKGVTAATTAATVRNIGAIALESAAEDELCRVLPVIFKSTIPA